MLVVCFLCYDICKDYYMNLLEKDILLTSSYLHTSSYVLERMKGKFKH
jgi:hypothetical protein